MKWSFLLYFLSIDGSFISMSVCPVSFLYVYNIHVSTIYVHTTIAFHTSKKLCTLYITRYNVILRIARNLVETRQNIKISTHPFYSINLDWFLWGQTNSKWLTCFRANIGQPDDQNALEFMTRFLSKTSSSVFGALNIYNFARKKNLREEKNLGDFWMKRREKKVFSKWKLSCF